MQRKKLNLNKNSKKNKTKNKTWYIIKNLLAFSLYKNYTKYTNN